MAFVVDGCICLPDGAQGTGDGAVDSGVCDYRSSVRREGEASRN